MSVTGAKFEGGLAPIVDRYTEVLILGSFPSVASLASGEYYGNPRNQFWRLMGLVLGVPLAGRPYEERLAVLSARGIGLWDVLASCERQGSLDHSIRAAQPNDFSALRASCPRLGSLLLNGQAAARHGRSRLPAGLALHTLPSTSPAAAALSLESKRKLWHAALAPHLHGTLPA